MQVAKWGNSLAVRIPAAVVEALLHLKEGTRSKFRLPGSGISRLPATGKENGRSRNCAKLSGISLPGSSSTATKPMNAKPFVDTNVVLYAFREGDPRSQRAETLLIEGGLLSVQVLNEFVNVSQRKLKKSWKEMHHSLAIVRVFCPEPAPLTLKTHETALHIAERYKYSIYDSSIIATALEAGCDTLYSEDLQDGQVIESSLTIRNPFQDQ